MLTDYNLPNGANGLDLVINLRALLGRPLPAIILTGDISTETMAQIAGTDCIYLSKPVKTDELMAAITRLCPTAALAGTAASGAIAASGRGAVTASGGGAIIHVVDDDPQVRATICEVLTEAGRSVVGHASAEAFLAAYVPGQEACLLVDIQLRARGDRIPVIVITGRGEIGLAVTAMRLGAGDFIEKPLGSTALLDSIARALDQSHDLRQAGAAREAAAAHIADLTSRQREVMELVLAGHPSKNIAADLGISQRTVENHRAAIMQRMGVKSLPELARLVVVATTG